MREYERSHPWITFGFRPATISERLWMALGEAQSKCEHIAGVPLKPEIADKLHRLYLAKGALATTAIEGNTLSEKEALEQIEGNLKLPEFKEYLGQAIQNIVDACNTIGKKILAGESLAFTLELIEEYNRMVLKELPLSDGVIPGQLNLRPVGVAGARYRGAPPEDCEYLLNRLCDWLNHGFVLPGKENLIAYGLIKAILAHIYLVWIHPFGDGNGRTARLMELQILLESGIPSPAAHLLSNHYNETREEYYRQLQMTSSSGGNIIPFIEYAVTGFIYQLKNQLGIVREEQWRVAWSDHIYYLFKGKNKPSDKRKRDLAVIISGYDKAIPLTRLLESNSDVALLYYGKTFQTIIHDTNELIRMGLIEKNENGIWANKNIILSFLPLRKSAK
jgi:Fic family protein